MDKPERIPQLQNLQSLEMGQEMVWECANCDKGYPECTYITRVPNGMIWKVDKYESLGSGFLAMNSTFIPVKDFFTIPDDYFNTESPDYVYKTKEIIENE